MKSYRMFFKWSFETVSGTVGSAGVMILFMILLYTRSFVEHPIDFLVNRVPLMMISVSAWILFIMFISAVCMYIPLGMSLNCSRKKSLKGLMLMKVMCSGLTALSLCIIQGILMQMAQGSSSIQGMKMFVILFFGFLVEMSVGELFGLIYVRYGKMGMLGGVVFSVIFVAFVVIVGMNLETGIAIAFSVDKMIYYVPAVAAGICLITTMGAWKLLKNLGVRC